MQLRRTLGLSHSFIGEQGWRSGESARLPPMWPGFKSRRRRHMWVEFVVGSPPCSERFFSWYSGFPLSSKTNISKFQFDQESGRRRTMWMCFLQIVIYLFIYLFIGCTYFAFKHWIEQYHSFVCPIAVQKFKGLNSLVLVSIIFLSHSSDK